MTACTAKKTHANPTRFIIAAVCDAFTIHEAALRSRKRTYEIATARQAAMFLLRTFTKMSLHEIAREFNKLNHCTVMHAMKAVADRTDVDSAFCAKLNELMRKCNEEFR
jgi:chromosomal replication initiator protein